MAQKVDLGAKFSDEKIDYRFTWGKRLGSDTIVNSAFTVLNANSALQVESQSFTANSSTVWVSGGTDGQTYNILNVVTTDGGRRFALVAKLKVATK